MNFEEFNSSFTHDSPPDGLDLNLLALWHEGKGDWEKCHQIVQDLPDPKAAHIHAYLHRKEGDLSNAAYWYRLAHQPIPTETLEIEWQSLVKGLLKFP